MATITLRKSKFDNIKNVLDKLGANFKNYQASLNELKHTAEALNSDECNLEETINDITSSDKSEKDKVEKIQQLNRKIETFVNTAIQKEKAAKREIVRQKKDFYKKYKHLEPDSEKSYLQRACEKYAEITKAINQWIVDHIDIIITAVIVLAAVVICIFCPAAVVAIIGIIAGALSAAMSIADMTCMLVNGGKGIAETLAENGHGTLAKIWSGTSNGLDIASIILPAGAGIKGVMEVTGKSFKAVSKDMFKQTGKKIFNTLKSMKHPVKALKNSSFVTSCSQNGIFKTLGKSAMDITGLGDFSDLTKIKSMAKGEFIDGIKGKIIKDAMDTGDLDLIAKHSEKIDTDAVLRADDENKMLFRNKNGKERTLNQLNNRVRTDMQNDFKDTLLEKINNDPKFAEQFKKQTGIDTSLKGKGSYSDVMTKENLKSELRRNNLTIHEDYNRNLVQIVPTDLHNLIQHNGGTSRGMRNYIMSSNSEEAINLRNNMQYDINGSDCRPKNQEATDMLKSYLNDYKSFTLTNKIIGNQAQKTSFDFISSSANNIKDYIEDLQEN